MATAQSALPDTDGFFRVYMTSISVFAEREKRDKAAVATSLSASQQDNHRCIQTAVCCCSSEICRIVWHGVGGDRQDWFDGVSNADVILELVCAR